MDHGVQRAGLRESPAGWSWQVSAVCPGLPGWCRTSLAAKRDLALLLQLRQQAGKNSRRQTPR